MGAGKAGSQHQEPASLPTLLFLANRSRLFACLTRRKRKGQNSARSVLARLSKRSIATKAVQITRGSGVQQRLMVALRDSFTKKQRPVVSQGDDVAVSQKPSRNRLFLPSGEGFFPGNGQVVDPANATTPWSNVRSKECRSELEYRRPCLPRELKRDLPLLKIRSQLNSNAQEPSSVEVLIPN